MDKIPFGPKPKIVDLTSDRKLADKVCALHALPYAYHDALASQQLHAQTHSASSKMFVVRVLSPFVRQRTHF